MRILTLLLLTLSLVLLPTRAHAGKNIFDDDWVAPKASERPASKPAPAPPTPKPSHPPAPTSTPTPARIDLPAPQIKPIVPAKRLAIPAPAEQAAIRKVMREVFAVPLTDRTIPGRKKLITALIAQADKSANLPGERFVLLAAAHDAAIDAVDLPLALRFADDLARYFEVDGLAVKVAAVSTLASKPAASREALATNVKSALALVDEVGASEDYDGATRLCQALVPAVAADAELRVQVQTRLRDITALRDAAATIRKDLDTLKTTPDDQAANLAVGRYYCFLRNDWPAGLPLLAKGLDAELKSLAAQELAAQQAPADVARLAEAWWAFSARQSDSIAKSATSAHSAGLYESVLPKLTGLQRELASRRVADAAKVAPPVSRSISGNAVRTAVTITATKSWQNVYEVHVGDVLTFTATGQVITSPRTRPASDPDGQPSKSGRPWGCLKGQIGDDSLRELFTIGSAHRHVVGRDGMLSLRADDTEKGYNDNSGEFKVIIDRIAAPKMALGDGTDRFVLPATDMICRTLKAGSYDVTAEGEWSMSPDGALYGPEGIKGARNLIVRQAEGHLQDIGKSARLTLTAETIVPFKIRELDSSLSDNRGSVTITITPAK